MNKKQINDIIKEAEDFIALPEIQEVKGKMAKAKQFRQDKINAGVIKLFKKFSARWRKWDTRSPQ